MRKFVLSYILLFLLFVPFISQSEEIVANKPDIYAVMMHADWCGACKAMSPKIAQARVKGGLNGKNVLFVKLDLTDEATQHQAAMMAEILGFTDLYNSNAGKTGFMLLIDANTGEKLARVTNKLDVAGIASKITETLKAVNS